MNIPWKLKSAAFRVFDLTGESPLYLVQKYLTKRGQVSYSAIPQTWQFHNENLEHYKSTSVIEFGAGRHLGQNIYLSGRDVRQTAVDLNRQIDIELVNSAIEQLTNLGVLTLGPVRDVEELEEKYRISYIAPLDMRKTLFKDGEFDACVSSNTLEHIPENSIDQIWKEIFRVLKSGGMVSAKIDYSDHYAHTDKSISRINYLRYKEKKWNFYNHSYHYQNRLRHRHHINLLTKNGFVIVDDRYGLIEDPKGLDIPPENLTGHESDYATEGTIVAIKP